MTRPKPSTIDQIRFAAALARHRKRRGKAANDRRDSKQAERRLPRLELLGATPDAAWLARVGKAQADLRSAIGALNSCGARLPACRGPIPLRAIQIALADLRALQRQLGALMPTCICPSCFAADPACQHCGGRGCLSVQEASLLGPEVLHDRE